MNHPPAISVIIPTYNWSAALRCAIRSVLLQTLQDFEIVVVGDACTDDSEAVVGAFDDPRIRWHNLEKNSGSQWAPNNYGLANATGKWVAYLGHDDIWYPTHLEAIFRAALATNADLVTSVVVMYGPPGSRIRGLAGIFPDGMCREDDFVPPSGLAHQRLLTATIGFWPEAQNSLLPVDCAYLRAAITAGVRVASTNELTTFKFNAAWRRDAYKLKSTLEQEEILSRIEAGTEFRQDELIGVLQARAADRLIDLKLPGLAANSPGSLHQANRRFKGVERRFAASELRSLRATERFFLTDIEPGFEWHLDETDARFGPFRWTGPLTRSTVDLPVLFASDLSIRLHIINAVDRLGLDSLRVFVNGRRSECRVERTPTDTFIAHAEARVELDSPPDQGLRLTIELDRVLRPIDLGVNDDRRWLGVAVNWIDVEPQPTLSSAGPGL